MLSKSLRSSPVVWSLTLSACSAVPATEHASPPTTKPSPVASTNGAAEPSASAPSASAAAGEPTVDVARELERRSVGGERVASKVLYSWTTSAQLDELLKGEKLLSREVSATRGPAAFDDFVSQQAEQGRDVAKLLLSEGFAKKRFAWASPFATVTGEGDGSYGNVLLRIELRDEAWIMDYASGSVFGVDGSRGTFHDALAHPERIAGVFFLGRGYREIVLVNESMVARWSAGGAPDVVHALRADIDFLLACADAIEDDHRRLPAMPSSTAHALEASLAFDRKLSVDDLRSRAKLLDTYRELVRAEVARTPNATFSLGKKRAPVPRVCRVARSEAHAQARYIGSFAAPKATKPAYDPVCEPTNPAVACDPVRGATPKEASCTPVPAFGQ